MPRIEFFDFNVILGRPNIPRYRFSDDPAAINEELAALGITGALVRHTFGEESHPVIGNARLMEAIAPFDNMRPAWAVLPHWTGEFPHPRELTADMKSSGVTAAVMYPLTHGVTMRPSVVGPLLEALEEAKIVLAVPQLQIPFPVVEQIAQAHPSLAIVLLEVAYSSTRELYPLLEHCPNVRIEISTYMVHQGIEEICRLFGAGRLLFGSRYPFYNPGAAVAGIAYAKVSDDEKRLISAGNAVALLGGAP